MKTKPSKLVDDALVWAVTEEELDSDLESNKIASESNRIMIPLKLESAQTIEASQQIDSSQIVESSNSINDLDLLTSLQKMKTEEQTLLEQKQQLEAEEQNLHNKLVQEIENKKTTLANLRLETANLHNKTNQLKEALGIEIYPKNQVPKINSQIRIETKVKQVLECDGLLSCPKPEKCGNYDSCLKKYMAAEMRNEDLRI